jgi:hypothetical protein
MEDGGLTQVRLSSKGFRLNVPAAILSVCDLPTLRLSSLHSTHNFAQQIRQARQLDYSINNVVALTSKPLKWYQRLAYTEPASNRRRVNNVGDYIVIRRVAGRLAQCFTMVFRNRPRPYVFLITHPLRQLLGCSGQECHRRLSGSICFQGYSQQRVWGLPALSNQTKYFIQAPRDGPWMADVAEDEDEFVLECDWDIDFM